MTDIKPIETYYNGYRFRSRLEARWAVFFDAMDIEYQYEPEGFEIDAGPEKIFYLPDFYLESFQCYAEVKGTDEQLFKDGYKIACAVDFEQTPCSHGLLILGDIPNPEQIGWGNIPMFSYLENYKCVQHCYAAFVPCENGLYLVPGTSQIFSAIYRCVLIDREYETSDCYGDRTIPSITSTKPIWTREKLLGSSRFKPLKEAFSKARQARFEHGETPLTNEISDEEFWNGFEEWKKQRRNKK